MTKQALLGVVAARRYAQNGTGRAIRERAGLSMRQVGLAVGVSGQAIKNWESGVAAPSGTPAVLWVELLDALIEQERVAEAATAQTA